LRLDSSYSLLAILGVLAIDPVAVAQSNADAFVAKIPGANITSSVTLATAGGFGKAGQAVAIPISVASAGTTAPTALQIDLLFDSTALTFTSATAGAPLTNAGKGVSSTLVSIGDVRLSTTGANQNTIGPGVMAYVSFTISPQFIDRTTPVTLVNCMSASASGTALSTGCTAGNVTTFTCDVNSDGNVSVADVQALINQALGLASPVNDMNQDGFVNVTDIQIVINALLGKGCVS
jgi:hypothetical protein